MNILFISKVGSGLDLAYHLEKEGANVFTYIEDKNNKELLDGLLKRKIISPLSVSNYDFAVFDDNDLEPIKRSVWLKKRPAVGIAYKPEINIAGKRFKGYEFGETLEQDRKFGKKLFKEFKIGNIFENDEFKTIDEAVKYLSSNEGPYVIKPEAKTIVDSSLTFVGELPDNRDAIIYLESLKFRKDIKYVNKIELEKRIQGVEIACGGWFNGKDWLSIDVNFEHKKFATGNENNPEGLGFYTGEMGTILKKVDTNNKLFKETIYKMSNWLKDIDFRGKIDISCIANDDGIFPLEFTPARMGYPLIYLEMEAMKKQGWVEFLYAVANGEYLKPVEYKDFAIGIVVCGEGFPSDEESKKRMKYLSVLFDDEIKDNIHFCDVVKMGDYILTVGSYICVVTARGNTIENAQYNVYNNILPKLYIPKSYYRVDIGNRVINQLEDVKRWGYLD